MNEGLPGSVSMHGTRGGSHRSGLDPFCSGATSNLPLSRVRVATYRRHRRRRRLSASLPPSFQPASRRRTRCWKKVVSPTILVSKRLIPRVFSSSEKREPKRGEFLTLHPGFRRPSGACIATERSYEQLSSSCQIAGPPSLASFNVRLNR